MAVGFLLQTAFFDLHLDIEVALIVRVDTGRSSYPAWWIGEYSPGDPIVGYLRWGPRSLPRAACFHCRVSPFRVVGEVRSEPLLGLFEGHALARGVVGGLIPPYLGDA